MGFPTAAAPRWSFGEPVETLRRVLQRGGVLAIPTESSYGLACDPRDPRGVAAVFRVKGRVESKGLPVVAANLAQLPRLGVPEELPELAFWARFWPGPVTAVLPVARALPAGGNDPGPPSVAVRIPSHERLRHLLGELGPLTATSLNLSGAAPILDPGEAARFLAGADAVVVDGGLLPGGPPSTLARIQAGQLEVLRAGAFPAARLTATWHEDFMRPRDLVSRLGSQEF